MLIQGDCMAFMPSIPEKSIGLILCDLPYGTTSCPWDCLLPLTDLWAEYKRLSADQTPSILTACQPFTSTLVMSNLQQFKHELIWHKSKSGSAFTAKYRPLAKHESVLVFGSGKVTYNPQMEEGEPYTRTKKPGATNNHLFGLGKRDSITTNTGTRYPSSVMFFQQQWRRQDQVHPTQKPVALMEYLIKTYSNPGDVVLDNCMGSGTTGIAALRTGRRFIGIERNEIYFKIAVSRITGISG